MALGYGSYLDAFKRNGMRHVSDIIGFNLTEEDLIVDIGMTSMLPRRRFLNHIAAIRGQDTPDESLVDLVMRQVTNGSLSHAEALQRIQGDTGEKKALNIRQGHGTGLSAPVVNKAADEPPEDFDLTFFAQFAEEDLGGGAPKGSPELRSRAHQLDAASRYLFPAALAIAVLAS